MPRPPHLTASPFARTGAMVLAALALAVPRAASAQRPEEMGALAFDEWDAGRVDAAGASIPTVVLYPTGGEAPYPLVGVIHGASRTGARHRVLAETLASRGFVVVLPDIPCGFTGCDHDANADQLAALLAWAEAQSADAGSPVAGLVDGSRAGLIGHSWGALASYITASRLPSLDALVLFDPNDDGTEGLDVTSSVMAPTAQLLAAVPGACNSAWREDDITPALPTPTLELTVAGSAHCDPEEPGDFVCPIGCGAGDASTSTMFRRYAVAWVSCLLRDDRTVAQWLGGDGLDLDEGEGTVEGVTARGLAELPCRGAPTPDAGVPDVDAGAGDPDAGTTTDAGGADAGAAGRDAGAAAVDAGSGGGSDGGCGCRAAGRASPGGALWVMSLLALAVRRRAVRFSR